MTILISKTNYYSETFLTWSAKIGKKRLLSLHKHFSKKTKQKRHRAKQNGQLKGQHINI